MPYKGSPELIQNLLRKRELLRQGDEMHKKIKLLLLIPGGGVGGGVLGAGAGMACILLDLVSAFDIICAVSTGAGIGVIFCATREERRLAPQFTMRSARHVHFLIRCETQWSILILSKGCFEWETNFLISLW